MWPNKSIVSFLLQRYIDYRLKCQRGGTNKRLKASSTNKQVFYEELRSGRRFYRGIGMHDRPISCIRRKARREKAVNLLSTVNADHVGIDRSATRTIGGPARGTRVIARRGWPHLALMVTINRVRGQ